MSKNPPSAVSSAPCPVCGGTQLEVVGTKNLCRVAHCGDCGSYFVDQKPVEAASIYHDYHSTDGYKAKPAKKLRRATRRLKKLKNRYGGGAFLDVGCNMGYAAAAAARLGFEGNGLDIDPVAIGLARETFPEANFYCEDISQLAEGGKRFDLIYSSEVIEHMPKPLKFIDALFTLLKPGGVAYLTTPDSGHWRRPRDFMSWNEVIPPEHLVWFNRASLKNALRKAGFGKIHTQWNWKPGIRLIAQKPL